MPYALEVVLHVDGSEHHLTVDTRTTLLDALRVSAVEMLREAAVRHAGTGDPFPRQLKSPTRRDAVADGDRYTVREGAGVLDEAESHEEASGAGEPALDAPGEPSL